jgi:putative ABC transport system permease protein
MEVIMERAPGVDVEAQDAIRHRALGIFDQTFAITRALTFLALIVASVGLYNALLALELLQQPARHLLHTMGLTAGEARIIAGWRVIGIGAASLVLALPLGVMMGWLLCTVINPRAFGWSLALQLQSESFLWPLCSALLVMMLVGLAPTPKEPGEEAGQSLA